MLRKLVPLIVLCLCAAAPAFAADAAGTTPATPSAAPEDGVSRQGWGLRIGYLKGGDLATQPIGLPTFFARLSDKPSLKDAPLIGAFYSYEATPKLRVEARLSLAKSKVEHVCPGIVYDPAGDPPQTCDGNEGSVNTTVVIWDVLFLPHFDWGRVHLGVPVGVGWTNLRADKKFAEAGWVQGTSFDEDFSASSGMHYYIGLRPYWDLDKKHSFFVEVRGVRFHRLVSVKYAKLDTFEASAGVSFKFGSKKKS